MLVKESDGERAVVTDFGLAWTGDAEGSRLSATGQFLGTPAYIAPEQIKGGEVGPAADVYAFGVVLFEMMTGRLPFEGATPMATALARLDRPPPAPEGLPASWSQTIVRCLAKDPAARFAGPGEVAFLKRRARNVLAPVAPIEAGVGACVLSRYATSRRGAATPRHAFKAAVRELAQPDDDLTVEQRWSTWLDWAPFALYGVG